MIRPSGKQGVGWLIALSLVASLGQLSPVSVIAQDGDAARATTFKALPQVRLIQSDDDTSEDKGRASWPWEFVFEDAARFAWVGFDALGGQLERDVVVIYEGMTVRVDGNGRYEVRFRAEAPRMPVTLRMQLNFCGTGAMDCPGTITLPPIRIEPDQANEPSRVDSLTHEVVYVGHSESLRRLGRRVISLNHANQVTHEPLSLADDAGVTFTRSGTARFGSIPAK